MGGGGGAWKVAYADFVTAMMAFFMVMWLTAQSSDVKQAVAQHFKNPSGKRLAGTDAKSLAQSALNGNGKRKHNPESGSKKSEGDAKVQKMSDEGTRSNIGKIISFGLNTTDLDDAGKQEIKRLLPDLDGKQYRIEVRGHAANNGGSARQAALDSLTISYRRATSVFNYLVDLGIDDRRIRVSAAGSSEPRYKENQVDPSQDSRVEVFLLTEMFEEPSSKVERMVSKEGQAEDSNHSEPEAKSSGAKPPAKGGH
jgi:chemotaxis protein MotB